MHLKWPLGEDSSVVVLSFDSVVAVRKRCSLRVVRSTELNQGLLGKFSFDFETLILQLVKFILEIIIDLFLKWSLEVFVVMWWTLEFVSTILGHHLTRQLWGPLIKLDVNPCLQNSKIGHWMTALVSTSYFILAQYF